MADPERTYYDEEELGFPKVEDDTSYEVEETPYMPQINEALEETHASYERLWEQYSSEQGIRPDEEFETISDEGMELAEESPENIGGDESGGMSAAA